MSSSEPVIIDRLKPPLPDAIRKVLIRLFSGYEEVIVTRELHGGLSGSRLFLVRPQRGSGAELRTVVKVDRVQRIAQEWEAYRENAANRVPNAAQLIGEPAFPPGSDLGGLRYQFVGGGVFDIESLYDFCRTADVSDIRYVLRERLFKILEQMWNTTKKHQPDLHVQTQYDAFLQPNLEIELREPPAGTQAHWLHPRTVNERNYTAGDWVELAGFRVAKVVPQQERLSLDMPADTRAAYRMFVWQVGDVNAYEVGQIIHRPFTGVVRRTRSEILREQAGKVVGPGIDLTAPTLTLPDGSPLPNPIYHLPALLDDSFDAYVANIHGDLNLQNVLVEKDGRQVHLIDFALSRPDHIIRDLLHLEMAIVTQLLPAMWRGGELTPAVIRDFYRRLHCTPSHPGRIEPPAGLEKPFAILETIHEAASLLLFKKDSWHEYYSGLIVYLLGALKFRDLDKLDTAPRPKQTAFWGAAAAQELLLEPAVACEQYIAPEKPSPVAEESGPRVHNQTNFFAPVSGPVHTGRGNIYTGGVREPVPGLAPAVRQQLQRVLPVCGPFHTDRALRSLFLDNRLYAWRELLPESPTRHERVNSVIEMLYERRNERGENGLVLFLQVLEDQTPPGDGCIHELARLRAMVEQQVM